MAAREGHKTFVVAAACIAFLALCSGAAAAVRLELKLDKGKTYYERSLIDQRMTNEVMGMQQVVHVVLGTIRKLDVLDVDGQGNMRVRYTYTWSRFKQVDPMSTVDYDSAQHSSPPGGAEGFAALLGQSYTLRLSPRGKVLEVDGLKALAEAVQKKLPPGTNLSAPNNPLTSFLDEQAVREMTEGLLGVYPDKPVEPGDSWTETKLVKRGLPMVVESTWTLQGLEGGVARIGAAETLKSDPDAPPMDADGMKMKIDLSGSQAGTIRVEQATGLIRTSSGRHQLKGQIRVGASEQGPFDMMTVPIMLDTTYTAEMSDQVLKAEPK
jgi:hypothetical protein